MENLGKITIIIPVYNAQQYISKCIESILNQSYTNLQILLIDDGSTDSSGNICDYYAEQDNRIQVFHTTNKGTVAARRLGIDHSMGEYIGFVDADDYIDSHMYEVLLRNLTKSCADFVHTGYVEEDNGKSKCVFGFTDQIVNLQSIENREKFLIQYVLRPETENISYSMWSKLYRSELVKKSFHLLPEEQQYGEDLFFLCLCILQSTRVALCRHALYHYVIQEQSITHFKLEEYAVKQVQLNYNLVEVLKNYNSQSYERLQEHINHFIITKFVNVIKDSYKKESIIHVYYLRNVKDLRGKKIAIYGAGAVGQDYYMQLRKYRDIEIVAWLDSNWEKRRFEYADVIGIDKLKGYDFDKIIIAVKEEIMAIEIKNLLLEHGIPEEKIIWMNPRNILEG